jgi:hypothetical protein
MLKGSQISGVVKIVIAAILYFFANAHSPNMGFGEMLTHLNGWILSEPAYYSIMTLAALSAIVGAVNIFNGFKTSKLNNGENASSNDSREN